MKLPLLLSLTACAALALPLVATGQDAKPLLDPSDETQVSSLQLDKTEVAVTGTGNASVLQATFLGGADYPTIGLTPAPAEEWDLTGKEGVEVEVTNKSEFTVRIAIRVDNPGDWQTSPWNTESISVEAGQTALLQVKFGFSNGGQPSFALDPAHVIAVKLFAVKPDENAVVEFKDLRGF